MPVLSGFLPIPLALMIPFMGAQSLVIGKQFGEGFQYGKRKISAMSNEEFNKLTPAILAMNSRKELNQMIPTMQQSIQDMRSFQSFLIQELIATAKQLPSDIFQGLTEGQDPNAHLKDNPFGTTDLLKALQKAATGQLVGYKPRDEITQTQNLFDNQYRTSGPIGPQQPNLDSLYSSLTIAQLRKVRNSPNTWGNIPKTQRILIQKILDDNPIIQETTTDAISRTSSGITKQIATLYYNAVQAMILYRQSPSNTQSARTKRNQNLRKVIEAMKIYNRFVQLNRKPQLSIDTAKSLHLQKIIGKQ